MIAGSSKTILWGEVDKVGDELFWCYGGGKLPKEPLVSGNTHEPFFLVSLNETIPNLYAINLDKGNIMTSSVYCVYSKAIAQQCKSGNRTKEPSTLENLLNKFS